MTQAQLLQAFSQLSLPQQLEVIQAALRILAQQFQVANQPVNGNQEHKPLAEAASLLLADYLEDAALTSFTALDGEPLYVSG